MGINMITTFTLNAAIDKCYRVDGLQFNKANRVSNFTAVPGGKGINVAKVVHALGAEVVASGFLGGTNGLFIDSGLKEMKIMSDFVWTQGNSRETISVIDSETGTITEFLEKGPVLREGDVVNLTDKLFELSKKSKVITFSGSIPEGVTPVVYADMIQVAKKLKALTILDTSGQSLLEGLKGTPDICKPNIDELEQLLGFRPVNKREIAKSVTPLIETGIRMVIVSIDKDGSIVVTKNGSWHVAPPVVKVVNTVGCGDSLVAGMAYFIDKYGFPESNEQVERAVKLATAVSASNAMNWAAGSIRVDEIDCLLEMVNIVRLE